MQLALTPEVLFPVGACAVVAAAVIAVIVVIARGKRAVPDDTLLPTAADWTGETATADPAPAAPTVTMPPLPQRLTVAEAVAVRDADTAPLPVSSAGVLAARPTLADPAPACSDAVGPAPDDADPEPSEPAPAQAEAACAEAEGAQTGPTDAAAPAAGNDEAAAAEPQPAEPQPVEARIDDLGDADSGRAAVTAVTPQAGPAPRAVTASTGSSPAVAAAVAHVLAYRAAVGREASAQTAGLPVVPSRTADARDRLLAVLLADPVRAVGAAEELAACRGQLGDVLARLAASGLSPDQLSRLSGFTVEQVTILLDQQSASR